MKNTAINLTLAVALAIALAASFNLDADDHRTEWDRSTELKELQASQASTKRREAAAKALCTEQLGLNSSTWWTDEGHLFCATRRGAVALKTAQAVRP